MEQFLSQLPQSIINGLTLGSVYALIALGYSLVYGILKMLNFAHGDVYMVGAYAGYGIFVIFVPKDSEPLIPVFILIILMLLVSMVGTAVLGMVIERFAYRPLRNAPRIAPLISALGVSFALQNLIQIVVSPRSLSFGSGRLLATDVGLNFGEHAFIHLSRIIVIGVTILMLGTLTYIVQRTKFGRAMRAVATDMDAAAMMGVNVDRIIVGTFILGSALAGSAGVLVGIKDLSIRPLMGFTAGLKGFTASVIGGIGSLTGAVAGGLLLGMAEAFATVIFSPTFKDAITFIILVVSLLIRPSGLLGKPVEQKV